MSKSVSSEQLGAVISQMLKEYTEEVGEHIRKGVDRVSKETVQDLRKNSPKQTGAYAKGWSKRVITDTKDRLVVLIANRTKPSLTHLLEYGHKKTGGGMVPARQHIRSAEEKAKRKLVNHVKAALK